MKKAVAVLGVLVLSTLMPLPAASAQPSETVPRGVAIDRAVSWAQGLVGKDSFSYGYGEATSTMSCVTFVAAAYGNGPLYTAYAFWTVLDRHPGDWDAPRGSLVFFDRNDGNALLGHVALCTGNGSIVQAGYPIIVASTITDEDKHNRYLGWAWSPASWPGRSDGPGLSPVWIAVICTAGLALGGGAFFLLHKRRNKYRKASA